jgi:hypothetical protein
MYICSGIQQIYNGRKEFLYEMFDCQTNFVYINWNKNLPVKL